MRRLSKQPAVDAPFRSFLLKNSDVVLALGGASVVMWQLAKQKPRQQMSEARSNSFTLSTSEKSLIAGVIHELRQVFTALLLGLGLIERKAATGNTQATHRLVGRLKAVVRSGIESVNTLDSEGSTNGHEKELGA
jgi:hypothetical protein